MHDSHSINAELMDAIASIDVSKVAFCLKAGADPNFQDANKFYKENPEYQPDRPLKLVMFRISDNLLDDDDLVRLKEIAKLLVVKGADPKPAMVMAEKRYGKYDPTAPSSPFYDVWNVISQAKK